MVEFELLGGADDETRLLRAPAVGYSVALVGHPLLDCVPESIPKYDCIVKLRDVHAELGFRIDDLPTTMEARALSGALATAYSNGRARTAHNVRPIPAALLPQTAAAGAQSIYQVSDEADMMEHLWLILRASPTGLWALYQTTRFRTADLNIIKWAHLRAAIIDQHRWDPASPRDVVPAVWPVSRIARPLAKLDLNDDGWIEASAKARDIGHLTEDQAVALVQLLCEFAQSDRSPREEVVPMLTDIIMKRVAMCGPNSAAEILLRNLAECRNTLDLRGWAWQCAWAIGNRDELASSST